MDLPLNLDALRAFEAVARAGGFAAAAAELGVSPSAVSHRVRGLEAAIGCPLLTRTTRSVALTDAGRVLAPAVRDAVARLRRAAQELDALRGGPLVVSCSPSFALRWLVPRLHRFAAAEPDIDVRVSSSDALVDPEREGVDVCLRYGPGGYAGLEALQLTDERVFPVCSPALQAELAAPADLLRYPLLAGLALRDHPARPGWRAWLAAAGVPDVPPERDLSRGLRFSHTALAIEAAIAGQGLALGRTTLVADALRRGLLVRPFPLALPSGLTYWFVTPPGGGARPAVAAFRRWVVSELART